MSDNACKTCMFYYKSYHGEICRYNPPVVIVERLQFSEEHNKLSKTTSIWPKVSSSDWCGKFVSNQSNLGE